MSEIVYESDKPLPYQDYLGFLQSAQLGRMYPKRDFEERITRVLANAGVTVVAREDGEIVGCCMGLTDFGYFLFLTDLSVAPSHEGRGVGKELVRLAIEAAGGADDITVITWAMPQTLPFYAELGIVPQEGLIARDAPIDAWFDPAKPSS